MEKNLTEITDAVLEGLKAAEMAIQEDPELSSILHQLRELYDKLGSEFLITSIGLTALKYRTPEQIRNQLRQFKAQFEQNNTFRLFDNFGGMTEQ